MASQDQLSFVQQYVIPALCGIVGGWIIQGPTALFNHRLAMRRDSINARNADEKRAKEIAAGLEEFERTHRPDPRQVEFLLHCLSVDGEIKIIFTGEGLAVSGTNIKKALFQLQPFSIEELVEKDFIKITAQYESGSGTRPHKLLLTDRARTYDYETLLPRSST